MASRLSPVMRSNASKAQSLMGKAMVGQSEMRQSLAFSQALEKASVQLLQEASSLRGERSDLLSMQQSLLSGGLTGGEMNAFLHLGSLLDNMPMPESVQRQGLVLADAASEQKDVAHISGLTASQDQHQANTVTPDIVLEWEPVQPDWQGVNRYGWGAEM